MNLLGTYRNGNYRVAIFDDGTKIRFNNKDTLIPEYPESIDLKITNRCDIGCPMCHEDSKADGKHGNIMDLKFIDTLLPYTELAIGGGNPLSHPDLIKFLKVLKEKKIIANITVNQIHFMNNLEYIKYLVREKLVRGVGVSLANPTEEFINTVKMFDNAVIHVVNGMVSINVLEKLAHKGLKVLILGYKKVRRGKELYDNFASRVSIEGNIDLLYGYIEEVIKDNWFDVISFDNLALEQLNPKRFLTDDEWNDMYMGDDGCFSMYIDAVKSEYSVSSTMSDIYRYGLKDDIRTMFAHVKEVKDMKE